MVMIACLSAAGNDENLFNDNLTVNDIMLNFITPATNTIWGVENPQSDADWQELADAAQLVIDASRRIRIGASGPNDADWAAEPAWQSWTDDVIDAGIEMLAAIEARDLDTLIDVSNDRLYPPCEECHLQFHPAMQEQEVN